MAENTAQIALLVSLAVLAILPGGVTQKNDTVVDLQANFATTLNLSPNGTIIFRVQSISDSMDFVLLQVHTQSTPVVLSLKPKEVAGSSTRGTSVGVIAMVNGQGSVYFYANTSHTTQAVVMATTYDKKSPIPGGCNMEFPMKLDPNIHLSWTSDQITISFQFADVGAKMRGPTDRCEVKPYQSTLSYEVYQYFLPGQDWKEETFLQTVTNSLTSASLRQMASKVKTVEYSKDKTRVQFAAYPGQGVMFGIIVREKYADNSTSEAAYVPVTTYTCQFDRNTGCQNLNDEAMKILFCVLGAFGLLICFVGHRFFKSSMFTFGMLASVIVSYMLISRFTDLSLDVILVLTGVCGIVGGVLWLILWCFIGVAVISVIIPGLVAGFIISSIAFNFTPLGLLEIFYSDFNYGMSFACGILVIPVILLAFTKKLSLFSCTLVGGYLIVAAVDTFIKSYITYVVLNAVRKGAIEGYTKTLSIIPIQLPGVLLLVAWGVLILLGLIVQTYSTRDQPDFPACPWDRYKERQQRQRQMEQLVSQQGDAERRPLMGQRQGRRHYGTRTPSAPQFQETPPEDGYTGMVDPL